MKRLMFFSVLLSIILASGCAKLAFVSKRNAHPQIYVMRTTGESQTNISNNEFWDRCPDVSPDGKKIVFSSLLRDPLGENIYIMDIDGGNVQQVTSGNLRRTGPRWSPRQDLIAFAEYTSNDKAKIFTIRADEIGTPRQVTNPTGSQSDRGGHDFFDNGNKIVFSRFDATYNTYDLYHKNADGTGSPQQITATGTTNETFPVVSHDGKLLAHRLYVMLAPGWIDVINVLEVGTWTPVAQITMQPPAGPLGPTIVSIAFSRNDQRLYVAARSSDVPVVPGTPGRRYEIFSIKIDDPTDQDRLTNNEVPDYWPSSIDP